MKKITRSLLTALLCLSFITAAKAQVTVGSVTPQNANLNPCNEYIFSVDISGFDEGTDTLTLNFNLPSGQSLTGTNYGAIINGGTAIEIQATGGANSFTLNYKVAVGCVFNNTTIPSGHTFSIYHNHNNTGVSRSTSYSVNSAWLIFNGGTNLSYTTAKAGLPVQRTFTYTNTSTIPFNGIIRFADTAQFSASATGIKFTGSVAASSGSVIGTGVTDTSVYIEVNVSLAQGESITFTDHVLLEKCPSGSVDNSVTRYHITYGCKASELCVKVGNSNSQTTTKFDPNDKPKIQVDLLTPGYESCFTTNQKRLIRIINTGQGNATSLQFYFFYNPSSISTIDLNNISVSKDITGLVPVSFSQTSGLIPSISRLATYETKDKINAGDTIYVRYYELMPCLDSSQYAGLFNENIVSHHEMIFSSLRHPCFSTDFVHPVQYGWRRWEHIFGLKQNFENMTPMMTDGMESWFQISNVTPLLLGTPYYSTYGLERFIYSMENARVQIELNIEAGLGLVADSLYLRSPEGSGYNTLYPDQVVFNYGPSGVGSGDKVLATFSFPPDFYTPATYIGDINNGYVQILTEKFIKFFNTFEVKFKLRAYCAYSDGGKSVVEQNVYYIPDVTCDKECKMPFSSVSDAIQINCPGCLLPGWNMHVFNVDRENFGLQDNNNNNYPDNTDNPYLLPANVSLAKTKRVMVGDTIILDIHGHTSNGDRPGAYFSDMNLDEGQFVLQGHLVQSLEFLGAEGIYHNSNSPASYPFTIPSSAGIFHSNGFTIDMGIAALNSYGVNISAYNENHQIEIKPRFRVKNNLINGTGGDPYFSVEDFNTIVNMSGMPFNGVAVVGSIRDAGTMDLDDYLLLSREQKDSLFYWCTQGLARLTGIGMSFEESQFISNTNLNRNPCLKFIEFHANTDAGKQTPGGRDYSQTGNQKIWNTFSYELRNLWMLDSITFNFPSELEYHSTTFLLAQLNRDTINNTTGYNSSPYSGASYVNYDFGDEKIAGNTVTIYPSGNFDLITKALNGGNVAAYDETKRYRIFLNLRMKDCQGFPEVIDVSNAYPSVSYWSNYPGVGDTVINTVNPSDSKFNKPAAEFITQVLNDQQNTAGADLSWDINIEVNRKNYSPYTDGTIFARADTSFIYIVSPSGNITVNNLINRKNNTVINPKHSINGSPLFGLGLIGADWGTWADAKLKLNAGFDCSELTGKDSLYIITGWNCDGYPAAIEDACYKDTTVVYIEPEVPGIQAETVYAPETASACDTVPYSIRIKATGLGEVENIRVKMTLPSGLDYLDNSGVVSFGSNSLQAEPVMNLSAFTWNLDSASFMNGFNGLDSAAYLNLKLISQCGFSKGDINFEIIGENYCGKPVPDNAVLLTGTLILAPGELDLDSLSVSVTAADMSSCSDSSKVTVTVINTGSTASSDENTLQVTLPGGFSTTGNTSTTFNLPAIPGGGSHTETFYVKNSGDSTCGEKEIIAQTFALASYFCQVSGDTCSSSISVSSDTTVFNVLYPSADFTLTSDTLCLNKEVLFNSGESCATSRLWDFGDGTQSTETSPAHTYASEGTYNVKHTITSMCGTDTKEISVYVIECCQNAPVTAGDCKKCDASMTVQYDPEDPACVYVTSCKELSNVVLMDCDGNQYKFDNLSGKTGYFCHPSGEPITTVWVKSGCFLSGDGPGYGRRFDHPCDACTDIAFAKKTSSGEQHTKIMIYPNPASENVTIDFIDEKYLGSAFVVYDHMGRVVHTQTINSAKASFDTNSLSPGNYFIKISGLEQHDRINFIKLK